MAGSRALRLGVLAAMATAVGAVGVGAYAFGPVPFWSARPRPEAVAGTTGESAAPGPAEPAVVDQPTGAPVVPVAPVAAPPPAPVECARGDRQREVETALAQIGGYAVRVDGLQSAADCAAIRSFQRRFGISPAQGRASATTADVARRIAASATAAEQARCGAGAGLTVCIDLTQQTVWAVRDGVVVLGPTVTRTGMGGGFQTPTGSFHIYARAARAWSKPYHVWLPYWQPFNGGIGLHETPTYIHNGSIGSHGCVNLLRADAAALWKLTEVGTAVHVFGRRPRT